MSARIFGRNGLTTTLLLLIIVTLSTSVAGCGADNQSPAPAPKVNYIVASEDEVTLTTELPGRISALMVSEVRPQVGGIIKERLFKEGTDVKAGQVLYQIEPSLYEAAYNNAKAELARVQANAVATRNLASRYAKLVQTGAISKQEYDDAKAAAGQSTAQINAAKEALETARINLSYTRVTAPVSGRIGRSFYTPGALVTQNQANPLATIQQLDYVYVDITQSSTEYLQLQRARAEGSLKSSGKEATKVKLYLEDNTPYAFTGKDGKLEWVEGDLLFSDVTIDQTTGAIALRAKFKNDYNILLPGMYVRAKLEEGVREGAVIVPQKAISRDLRGGAVAYVLSKKAPSAPGSAQNGSEGKNPAQAGNASLAENEYYVSTRDVTIERNYENSWIIKDGIKPGDRLVMDGLLKLHPGQKVLGVQVKTEPATRAANAEKGLPANFGQMKDAPGAVPQEKKNGQALDCPSDESRNPEADSSDTGEDIPATPLALAGE